WLERAENDRIRRLPMRRQGSVGATLWTRCLQTPRRERRHARGSGYMMRSEMQLDNDVRIGLRRSLCGLPALALLLFFFVVPLIALAHATLQGTAPAGGANTGLVHIQHLLADRLLWELLGFTFALAAALTVICLSLGYGLALFLWGLKGRWKAAAVFALLVPKLSNILITAYGLKL